LSTNENSQEEASPNGREMLINNSFPDEAIIGPSNHALLPQPESKEQLADLLTHLKADIAQNGILQQQSPYAGKTKHPGLLYFNAGEWCQFANMHFRHHWKQKERIDQFLKLKGYTNSMQISRVNKDTVTEKD
jgi:hypothetical protein